MEDYLSSVYDFITKQDNTFSGDVDIETFKSKMQDDSYAKEIYSYMSSVDNSFASDVKEDAFLNAVKKKDIGQTTSSILERTQQGVTSNLEGSESTAQSEEFKYPDFTNQPEVTEPDLSSQLQVAVDKRLEEKKSEGNNFLQEFYAKITSTDDLEDIYSTDEKHLWENDWLNFLPEMPEDLKSLSDAESSFYNQKGSEFGIKKKEYENKLRYLSKVLENPEEYAERNFPENKDLSI